jgi:ATP adenylyltransferase
MMDKAQPIPDGALWQWLCQRSRSALDHGALQQIDTREQIIVDGGIPFVVRVAQNLRRKAEDRQINDARRPDFNPFLPPEAELTVGTIGAEHVAVLNKFNVVEHHLLIVTRRFVPQEALLTPADFEALCWSLREIDGLGFYNGGTVAGASQRHKHLQLIPLPLTPGQRGLPIEQVLPLAQPQQPCRLDSLPFPHRIATLPANLFDSPDAAADHCQHVYREMLEQLRMSPVIQERIDCQSAPYNLLLTRRWLMLVPRTCEHFESISINAMGFAGSLFVRNTEELKRIEAVRPLHVLQSVSSAR